MKSFLSNRGFTLIETLIALSITISAGVMLTSAWSSNYLFVRKAALNKNIAQLLSRKMTEMEAKYRNKPILEIKEESGDFGEEFANYKWAFSVKPLELPDLAILLGGDDTSKDQTLLTILNKMREAANKAIVEGTVTVTVVVAKKEMNYSVTNYFVDFESEPDLGMSK